MKNSPHETAPHHRHHQPRAVPPRPLALGVRPQRWQRVAVHTTIALLFATGAAWLVAHFLLTSGDEFAAPSPLEPWALRLHGIAAYAFVFVFGSMSAAHIAAGWRLRRSRISGVLLATAGAVLGLSALLLYYAPEGWHANTSLLHWLLGLSLLPLLWAHVWAARKPSA